MQKLFGRVKQKPLELIIGICILTVAAAGGAVLNLASTALAVMVITSLFYVREWRASWMALHYAEKLVCAGFVLYTISGLISYINVADDMEFLKQFGRYLRFTLIIPVYLIIRSKNLDVTKYLLIGVVLSGFIYLGFALHDVSLGLPASGHYHRITFGNAVMLNVGIMSLFLLQGTRLFYGVVVIISLLCGLYAAILSGSRGAWMVLPVYIIIFFVYAAVNRRSAVIKLCLAVAMIAVIIPFTSVLELLNQRYAAGVTDIVQFKNDENHNTSLGTRLALWHIAYDVWRENPVLGTGLGDFDNDMIRYQEMGMYPDVIVNSSTHNIYMQALVGAGVIGFVALLFALIIMPVIIFVRRSFSARNYSLMGMILIISYAVFGLSESWMLRAPVVSIYLVYIVSLLSATMKEDFDSDDGYVGK